MATKSPRIDHPLFQNVEAEINSLFNQLVERVNSRRDMLVSRMYELWNSYEYQIRKRESTIKDVEKMRHRMEIVSIEDNVAVEIQRRSVVAFEEQIRSLEETVDPPSLIFSGSLTEELLDQVDRLGELFECSESDSLSIKKSSSIDYKNKKKAVLTIGTKGTKRRHFNRPSRIHIDVGTKRLYVPDSENRRVQVMSTTGEFITQFGQEEMQFPVSVATDRKHIYVSDNAQDCILRYKLSDFTFVNSEVGTPGSSQHFLKLPRGIIVSEDGEVMVADNNHRICVFKSGLSFLSEFGRGHLNFPQSIQIKTDKIFVLDCGNPCLHIFNKNKEKISSVLSRGFMKQVREGVSFCLDQDGNILIADKAAKRLKIFSPEAGAIHAIGDGLVETEDVGVCWGVAVYGGKIFVAGRSDSHHFVKVL